MDMELINGYLILCMNDFSINVYSATDYTFTSSFGERGHSDAFGLPQFLKSSSPYLYLIDVNNKNEIRKYQIDSSGYVSLLQTCFAGINGSMNRPYIVGDSLIVYDEFIPEASIKIHNLRTNAVELSLPYSTTSLDKRFLDKNMGGLYANDTCIAFVYKYQDRIDFYNWQFNLVHSVNQQKSEPKIYPPKPFSNVLPKDNVLYYGSSYMGQNYFYTLYRGVSFRVFRSDSIMINKQLDSYIYGLTRDVLEVYDYNGQPVCRFHFDDVSPAVFVVDEDQNRLIGYREVYRDSILVYQLQGLPKNRKNYSKQTKPTLISSLPFITKPENPEEVVCFKGLSMPYDVAPTFLVRYGGVDNRYFYAYIAWDPYIQK